MRGEKPSNSQDFEPRWSRWIVSIEGASACGENRRERGERARANGGIGDARRLYS